MTILTLFLVIVCIGVLLWLVNTHIPMDANIKKILNVAVIIFLILWLIYSLFPGVANIRVGH